MCDSEKCESHHSGGRNLNPEQARTINKDHFDVTLRTEFVSAANIFVQQSRNRKRPLFRIFTRNSD